MINKIEGTRPVRTSTSVRRTARVSESGVSFAKQLDDAEEAGSAGAVAGTNPMSLVTGVLGLQEVDDATARASRGKLRAENLLEQLEDMKLEILCGTLTREKLMRLARLVNSRRVEVTDPRLAQILDEIDLRAQVELAKYSTSQ